MEVSAQDVKDASAGVLKDLKRFQGEKEDDLKRYMVRTCQAVWYHSYLWILADLVPRQIAFARCHVEWAKANEAAWEEAKTEVENIEIHYDTHHTVYYGKHGSSILIGTQKGRGGGGIHQVDNGTAHALR